MIRTLLIANRGEIAVRLIRACRERGIETVAVYSEADAGSQHVRLADRSVCIGPPASADSYLNVAAIVDAARTTSADAIHPGYGFLSESAALAAACEAAQLTFVGPRSRVIAKMGSKIEARRLMQEAGVPVVPGVTPKDQSDAGLQRAIDELGLPVLVKASAGGGGKGMRRIRERAECLEAIQAARREADTAFGDGTLYVERLIERGHHVEVQVMADAGGQIVHLFERECSVQRRHQKVIEESPAPSIGSDLRQQIAAAGVAAARAAEYRNAGTIEFLVDVPSGQFYFLEMNTRLQVEHPVTEAVAGVDLVHAQLDVASGGALPWTQGQLTARGHALEARVYAEDPDRGFLPQTGRILLYREPRMPGVRVDSGFGEGDTLSIHYDPLIAKVIAAAETRVMAIARLREALRSFAILGIRTNIPFLLRVLDHPQFVAGHVDTGFLDREAASLVSSTTDNEVPPAVAVAMDGARSGHGNAQSANADQTWDPWSDRRGASDSSPSSTADRGANVQQSSILVARDSQRIWAWWNGRAYRTDVRAPEDVHRAAPRGPSGLAAAAHVITAPMPGTVLKIAVQPGARVEKGDTLAILEAMKMELPLRAEQDGVVAVVHAREGQLVQADDPLVELAP